MADTPLCPACGKDRVAREIVRVVDRQTGRCTVPAGWYVCFDCWACWDGVTNGDGILPPYVKARGKSDD